MGHVRRRIMCKCIRARGHIPAFCCMRALALQAIRVTCCKLLTRVRVCARVRAYEVEKGSEVMRGAGHTGSAAGGQALQTRRPRAGPTAGRCRCSPCLPFLPIIRHIRPFSESGTSKSTVQNVLILFAWHKENLVRMKIPFFTRFATVMSISSRYVTYIGRMQLV